MLKVFAFDKVYTLSFRASAMCVAAAIEPDWIVHAIESEPISHDPEHGFYLHVSEVEDGDRVVNMGLVVDHDEAYVIDIFVAILG